jgi:hypothetical protein
MKVSPLVLRRHRCRSYTRIIAAVSAPGRI